MGLVIGSVVFGCLDFRRDRRVDGWTDGWVGGWRDRRVDGWTDGWMICELVGMSLVLVKARWSSEWMHTILIIQEIRVLKVELEFTQ